MSSARTLSVSVIQFTSRDHLRRCLEALMAQLGPDAEVIVPHDDGMGGLAELGAEFPGVRFLRVPGTRSPAELRAAAAREAEGWIVAFLEDHCVPVPDWSERLIAAHSAGHAAIGGAVDKGFPPGRRDDSALNWAIYLTDYSRYMNPQSGGVSHSLTDCNVSYKRAALETVREAWSGEFHENIVNGLLRERSETLWLDPAVLVLEQRSLTLRTALRDRFAFGRLFASTRVAGAPLARRLAFAAFALAMPPVLVLRAIRNVMARGRYRLAAVRSIPHLFLVSGTWMFGESLGYLTGRPAAARAAPGNAGHEAGLVAGRADVA